MRTVHYNRGDEILEVSIRDSSGAKIEVRRCNLSDSVESGKILKWLREKYGFTPTNYNSFMDIDSEFMKF